MHVHEVKQLRRRWQTTGGSGCRHKETASERTVTGYKTGRVVCTTCGATVGILPQIRHAPRALASLGAALVSEFYDINAALDRASSRNELTSLIAAAARRFVHADGATCILREGEWVHYVAEDAFAPLWSGKRFPATACISGWAMLHRCTTIIPDIGEDTRIPIDWYRPTFVKSLVVTPVGVNAVFGAIGTYWKTRHAATSEETDRLHRLADMAARALARIPPFSDANPVGEEDRT